MAKQQLLPYLFTCGLVIGLLACQQDTKLETENLSGEWTIVDASRSGRKTQTLNGAYYHFVTDSTMRTNLLGTDMESPYRLEENVILQTEPEEIRYVIEELTDTSLVLNTKIRDTEFNLIMRRSESVENK